LGNFGEFIVIRLSRARLVQFFVALAVLFSAVALTSSSAQAASLNGAFTNIKVTAASGSGPIYPWEQIRVAADWSVPDKTPAGTTFSLTWPAAQLSGVGGSLTLKNTAGDTVATCTLGTASLDCALTAFVTTHPYNIKGSVWFTLTQVDIPENSTVSIPFTAGTTKTVVQYPTTGSVPNSFTGIDYYKDVWVHDGTTTWYIYLPGGKTGQTADYNNVVIEDTLGGNQTFLPGTFTLEHGTKLNSAGTWPIWQTAAKSLYTVTPIGTNSFTFKAPVLAKGGWWRLVYDVKVDAGYKGQISNTSKASWDTHQQVSTTHTEIYLEAGGVGSGEIHAVSVGDTVWWDKNGDGIQNDGPGTGIADAVLTLTGPDGKPVTDVFGKAVAPITTGATGVYLFQNLPPLPAGKHYTVTVTPPAGYTPTQANVGTDRAVDSSTGSAASGDLTTNGDQDLTLDFGFVKGAVSVGDYVWFDTNRNGLQDSSEPGIPAVTLTLTGPGGGSVTDQSGKTVAPTTTDANGKYLFANLPVLPAGQHYTVTVTPPAGYVATTPNAGTDRALDSSTGSSVSTDLVVDGAKDLSLDFGFVKGAVSVGDFVWLDTNRNGIQDTGEPGIQGVTLTLTGPTGGAVTDLSGAQVTPTTTDAAGAYGFSNLPTLPAGQHYTVTVTSPDGYLATTPGVGTNRAVDSSTGSVASTDVANNGDKDLTLDFGFVKPVVSVGDFVWLDSNKNGLQDAGEPGLAGVTLTLSGPTGHSVTDNAGNPVNPVTTDATGKYLFGNLPTLPAGQHYTVTVTAPAAYAPTLATVGTDRAVDSSTGSATSTDLVTDGSKDLTLDFGFVNGSVSVGDYVWFDTNRNGLQDAGEPGIPSVTLTLTGPGGGAVTDLSGTTVAPTTTDPNGKYLFANLPVLPAGQHYTVTVTPPTGFIATLPTVGTDRAVDSSTGSAQSSDLATDAAKDLTLDFGFVKGAVSVGDFVWVDTNRNGIQDAGEPGIPGATLTLTGPTGEPVTDLSGATVAPTTTDASGKYGFSNLPTLPAGQHYTVTVTTPDGYTATTPTVGADRAVDSSTGSATSGNLVDNGAKDLTLDFGFVKPVVSVGDFVWVDSNKNGLQDTGEPGLAGATLTLTGPTGKPVIDNAGNPVNPVTTDATGKYLFSNLPALPAGQHYTVTVTPPAGYGPTTANVGSDPAVDSSTGSASSTDLVNNGDQDLTLDFGFTKILVSVGDYVWLDVNRDGLQTAGEPGIPGVTVKLLKGGAVIATTTTDAGGYYGFGNLDPSTAYTVQFVVPTGSTVTTKDAGGDSSNSATADLTDSDAAADGLVPFVTTATGLNNVAATKADNPGIDLGLVTQINLTLAKTIQTKGPVRNGAELTYTLTPHNDGPVAALAGWSVTDVLPAGMTLASISGDGYTCDATTDPTKPVCVAASGLAAGADGSVITVTTKVTIDFGSLKNVAYVSPANGDVPETNPLVVPALTTDTSTSATDNDAQASIDVASPVSVGDYVWWDINRDGLQTSGEPGIPDVTVTLLDADGTAVATTKTDASGYYAFAGLTPGQSYSVVFTTPAGAAVTTRNAGSDDAIDSDAFASGKVNFTAPTTGADLTAPRTADLPTIDAGFVKLNLSLTKSVTSVGPYVGGANVTYQLVPHNDGPVDALPGWSVTEVLPSGSTLVGLSGDGYTCFASLVCTNSSALPAGADAKPITVVVQIPAELTGPFKNVAYISPAETETPETNPLVVPVITTDTTASETDNDAQAVIDVQPPQVEPAVIVITLPNTGTTIPLTWLLGAIGIVAAGVILLGASRFNAGGRKH
jgi:uncharacterized repeat protein (TIGR01451 family)